MVIENKKLSFPKGRPLPVPPEDLMKIIGCTSAKAFLTSGQHFLRIFRRFGGLKPSDRVLDVGCGCGRAACPITGYLTTGSYDGFDVVPELVNWCRENITPRHARFRFEHIDVANSFYYAQGAMRAGQFRFPYDDTAFDFTILLSVFTHMLADDLKHYAGEIARTLKPGGTAFISFFVLNDESRRMKARPQVQMRFPFRHGRGGIMVQDRARPEGAVAYPEEMVCSILRANGLEVQAILFGSWCGRERAISFQDMVVARKMKQGPDRPASMKERIRDLALRLGRWRPRLGR